MRYDENQVKDVFDSMWKAVRELRDMKYTDDAYAKFVDTSKNLYERMNFDFAEKVILAVVKEADDLGKGKTTFDAVKNTYNKVWKYYKKYFGRKDEFYLQGVHEYYVTAEQMASKADKNFMKVCYDELCEMYKPEGEFMKQAFMFFQKYHEGMTDEAYQEAEEIIRHYPEFTLHMMNMMAQIGGGAQAA